MKKRILSALLAIVMILSIVPVTFAAEVVLPGGATEWAAEQSANTVTDGVNYWPTLSAAVTAIDNAKQVGAVLYCKPDADVGRLEHVPVCSTLTIYGNGATVAAGGERDFDIGNTDPSGGKDVTADMTLTVYDLNGCGAWGTKATAHTVNLVFIGCKDMGKVYLVGTAGVLNITLTDCSFTSNDNGGGNCKVYSNADGALELTRVAFSNVDKAVNLNHKAAGVQTVTITDCSFTDCGNDVATDEIPVRVLTSVAGGKSVLNVSGSSFSGTPEGGADILLDYGAGKTAAKIGETAANVLFMESDTEGETTVLEATDAEEFRNYVPVASIGAAEFTSLQEAINETAKAAGTYEIKLVPGVIEESVTIVQKAGVYLTVTGAEEGTTLKGMITVDGRSAQIPNQSVTIDGVDIEATSGGNCIFIPSGNSRYSRNLTVKNCDFTGEGAVGIKQSVAGCINWLIQNCSADETMHSLVQAVNVEGLVIDGCTVRSKNGINLNSSSDVEIKNSTIEVRGYAVRAGVSSGGASGAVTLTENILKTDNSEGDAAIVLRGAAATEIELKMEENIVSGETHISGTVEETNIAADNNYWDGETDPIVSGAAVDVNSYYEDENLEELAGDPAKYEAQIGNELYEKFDAAFAALGEEDVLTLLKEIKLEETLVLDGAYAINGVKPNGTIELLDGASLTAPEGWDVITAVEGKEVVYRDGVYSLAKLYEIVYTDGVEDAEIFEDQCFILPEGSETPDFYGDARRSGYIFTGWTPVVADIVTGNVTYIATYEVAPKFEDVPADAYFADAITWAAESNIVKGVEEDVFAPEAMASRAQVITFLWRAAGAPKAAADTEVAFIDIEEGSYYYDAVVWAVENGITNGTTATTFSPDAGCTRAQVVTFLWRAAGKPVVDAEMTFTDVEEGTYYYDAVLWAQVDGITNGVAEGIFAPEAECTRAQSITMLYRILG